jgi:hypothetical protein
MRACTLKGIFAMRLWSLHPKYFDRQGLLALWREALLAQAVLHGKTKGYRHHPQLERFRQHRDPQRAIASYLCPVAEEAHQRGYAFDNEKIICVPVGGTIAVTHGQITYEWRHLLEKLSRRSPHIFDRFKSSDSPDPHPFFHIVDGDIAPWEKNRQSAGY